MMRCARPTYRLACGVAALAAGSLIVLLAGCATAVDKQLYVDWIAVNNPATVCSGNPDCVRRSTYKGKDLCTIITADKSVSYSRLGEQVRTCLK
jgi:hypothetical protein